MRRWIADNVLELVLGAGTLAIFVGLWWIFPPAALIFVGVEMMVLSVWCAKAWAERPDKR